MNSFECDIIGFATSAFNIMRDHVQKKYAIEKFNPKLRYSFSPKRKVSWGGVNDKGETYINLCLKTVANHEKYDIQFPEYKHIHKDTDIGSLRGEWKQYVACLIAHEMAHVVQHYKFGKGAILTASISGDYSEFPSRDFSSHGKLWQSIYRDLRCTFVNDKEYIKIKHEPFKPVVIKASGKTRVVNKPYRSKETNRNGGRYVNYVNTTTNRLIATLFKREYGKVWIKMPGDCSFTKTEFDGMVEARKKLIDVLVG